jgi:FKBP-type peptidyl-prolyl cis-trans isomerase FkpA
VNSLAESRQKLDADEQAAAGKTFREKAAKEAGATTLPSGVIYRTQVPGTGNSPPAGARVNVHYEGKLITGEVFDSSRRRGEPATFPLSGVISCWTEGVGRMKTGEKAVLVCPPETAYGEKGRPPTIPGQATLIFEVELLSFDPTPAPASGNPR